MNVSSLSFESPSYVSTIIALASEKKSDVPVILATTVNAAFAAVPIYLKFFLDVVRTLVDDRSEAFQTFVHPVISVAFAFMSYKVIP